MNANESPTTQPDGYQELSISLDAITMIAMNIRQLSSVILDSQHKEDTAALASSIEMLASLTGCHVDHASKAIGKSPTERNLKDWFMPRSYLMEQAAEPQSSNE